MSTMRALMPRLGVLLDYPGPDRLAAMVDAGEAVSPLLPDAAEAVRASRAELAAKPLAAWEELYTRTFDVAPACAPYVSIHTLGEESWQRAELMVGLAEAYDRVGFLTGPELPDHLGVILRAAPHLEAEEWRDLARLCVAPAIGAMEKLLAGIESPYLGVITAIRDVVAADLAATGGAGVSPIRRPPDFVGAPSHPSGRAQDTAPACRIDFQEDSRA